MGRMIQGEWVTDDEYAGDDGEFRREETSFRNWIRADGSGAFDPEPDRYHLYIARACPWAHRTTIMRRLKGLTDVISMDIVDPYMGEDGWWFSDGEGCTPDTVNGFKYLREVYRKADPEYTGRVTVPVLWDKQTGTIVNNESREIMRMLDTEFEKYAEEDGTFLPDRLAKDVERVIDVIYEPINNGVYRAGFARTQEAYDEAVSELFEALDHWEEVLDNQRYMAGNRITEADWCMFTTLYRFDPVYHTHFKCNVQRLMDYDNLWNYTKELYQYSDVSKTCDLRQVKQHYYRSQTSVNPTGIVPKGPVIDYESPHDR